MFRGAKTMRASLVGLSAAIIWCWAGPAHAQSTYVGASVLAEVSRFGSNGFSDTGGEAFGVGLRVGTAITDRWGIDLEFARPGEVDEENPYAYLANQVGTSLIELVPSRGALPPGMPPDIGRPISGLSIPYISTTTRRYSTLTVMPYVRQPLGSRADIVYLGGIAFVRTTSDMNVGGGLRFIGLPANDNTWVAYNAAPAVGLDVRVLMTDRLKLVPGMRLLAIDEGGRTGWVMRPSVGLHWAF